MVSKTTFARRERLIKGGKYQYGLLNLMYQTKNQYRYYFAFEQVCEMDSQ